MDDYGNGIPAREEPPQEAGRGDLSQDGENGRLFRLLSRISACAFTLYSLLLFLLFLASVEKLSYSGFGNISVNVYQAGLGICTALIVFAALSLAASLFVLAIGLLPVFAPGKRIPPLLGKIARALPLFFYFLLYSLACSLTGATSMFGGAGAAPALILSFTIVFALVHIVCLLLPKYKK